MKTSWRKLDRWLTSWDMMIQKARLGSLVAVD